MSYATFMEVLHRKDNYSCKELLAVKISGPSLYFYAHGGENRIAVNRNGTLLLV